jgi:hypothetical protein
MQKENKNPEYVIYMGKSVLKEFFRTYVYAKEGDEKKLVNSWKEYKELINSGEWVDEKKAEIIEIKPKLKKN